jgi:hypothetical protein
MSRLVAIAAGIICEAYFKSAFDDVFDGVHAEG